MSETLWQAIERHTRNWSRTSNNTLVLWFEGFQPQAMFDAEAELMERFGTWVIGAEFDRENGMTRLEIREKRRS